MKTFKIILSVLLSIIFVISLSLNILLLNNTYGTLVFKYDEEKLKSMIMTETESKFNFISDDEFDMNTTTLKLSGGQGYLLEYSTKDSNGNKENSSYHIYLDEKKGLTYSYKSENSSGNVTERYYINKIIYTDTNGVKRRMPKLEDPAYISEYENNITQKIVNFYATPIELLNDIKAFEVGTTIDFSFSPFYVLGIKATFKEKKATTKLGYDLSGNLCKITETDSNGKETIIKISEKNKPIETSNLDKFPLER